MRASCPDSLGTSTCCTKVLRIFQETSLILSQKPASKPRMAPPASRFLKSKFIFDPASCEPDALARDGGIAASSHKFPRLRVGLAEHSNEQGQGKRFKVSRIPWFLPGENSLWRERGAEKKVLNTM